jgi:hypothetical protein
MSAFAQPETDSEDELPAGWEERATLGEFDTFIIYASHALLGLGKVFVHKKVVISYCNSPRENLAIISIFFQ